MSGLGLALLWLVFLSSALTATVVLAPSQEEAVVRKRLRDLATASADPDVLEERRLARPFAERVLAPVLGRVQAALWARTPAGTRERIEARLVQAGRPFTAAAFVARRLYAGLLGFALGYLSFREFSAGGHPAILGLSAWGLATYVATILPEVSLARTIQARQKAFRRAFPDVLDLLCVSVEAGLGLDGAIGKVTEKFTGPVHDEFAMYLRAIRMGTEREAGLRELAERVGLPELRGFVGAVVQAERLGSSIAQVLRLQSEEMRVRRRQAAQEQSMRAPIKLLFPLVLFIFPSIFVILLGPAVIHVIGAFRGP